MVQILHLLCGIVHGLGSAFNKIFNDLVGKNKDGFKIPNVVCIIINFIFVSLAWVVFRAESVTKALSIIGAVGNTSGIMYVSVYVAVYVLIFAVINIFILKKNGGQVVSINMDLDKLSSKLIVSVWVWLIIMFMYVGNSAFIYAQF